MTAPASTTSRLARIRNQLYNALVMDDFDQQQLTDTLLGQRIEAYKGAINKQIVWRDVHARRLTRQATN